MVKYIFFRDNMAGEYFYHDEMLLISADLPTERILEIINGYMRTEEV